MAQDAERAKLLKTHYDKVATDIDAAIKANISTPVGRRFLWWLLQIGKVNTQPFATNALLMGFNSGELNVGNQILARITEVAPDGYLLMMKENADERNQLSRLGTSDEPPPDPTGDGDDS